MRISLKNLQLMKFLNNNKVSYLFVNFFIKTFKVNTYFEITVTPSTLMQNFLKKNALEAHP